MSVNPTRTFVIPTSAIAINHYAKEARFDIEEVSEKLLDKKVTLDWQTSGKNY